MNMGGVSSVLKGNLFEKVGVNISTVSGQFPDDFKHKIKVRQMTQGFCYWNFSYCSYVLHLFCPSILGLL